MNSTDCAMDCDITATGVSSLLIASRKQCYIYFQEISTYFKKGTRLRTFFQK